MTNTKLVDYSFPRKSICRAACISVITIAVSGCMVTPQNKEVIDNKCRELSTFKIDYRLLQAEKNNSEDKIKLFQAIEASDERKLETLLKAKPELANTIYEEKTNTNFIQKSALHIATRYDDIEIIKVLLKYGADPNALDNRGYSPLSYAVSGATLPAIKLLIESGAAVDWSAGKYRKYNLLTTATARTTCPDINEDIVVLLISKGAKFTIFNREYFKIILSRDYVKVMEHLLENKLDITQRDYSDGLVHARSKEMQELLIKYGAKRYRQSNDSITTLASYIAYKTENEVLELLDSGYDLSQENPDLLLIVAQKGLIKVAQKLIDLGFDINQKFKRRPEYIVHTAAATKYPEFMEFLLSVNPQFVNKDSGFKEKPLHRAAQYGSPEIIKLLVEKGAELDPIDKQNNTPLYLAVKNGKSLNANFLIEKGANTNYIDKFDKTLLHYAIENKDGPLARRLIRKGVDINHQDTSGDTPLLYAVSSGDLDMVSVLLDAAGINTDLKNVKGETALSIATTNDYATVVKLLKTHKENKNIVTVNSNDNQSEKSTNKGGDNRLTAKMILDKVIAYYDSVKTYHDAGLAQIKSSGNDVNMKQSFRTTYTKNDGIKMEWTEESTRKPAPIQGEIRAYKVSYKLWGDKKCLQLYYVQNNEQHHVSCKPIEHYHPVGYSSATQRLVPYLLFGRENLKNYYNNKTLKVKEESNSDDKAYYVISIGYPGKPFRKLWIDQDTYYIARYEDKYNVVDYEFVAHTSSDEENKGLENPQWKLTGNQALDNGALAFYRGEYFEAQRFLRPLVKEREPNALYFEAQINLIRKRGSKDIDSEINLLYLAAIQGHPQAQAAYADTLLYGYAYKLGTLQSQFTPEELTREVLKWRHKAADNCHMQTLNTLIDGYRNGINGMKINKTKTIYWQNKKTQCIKSN